MGKRNKNRDTATNTATVEGTTPETVIGESGYTGSASEMAAAAGEKVKQTREVPGFRIYVEGENGTMIPLAENQEFAKQANCMQWLKNNPPSHGTQVYFLRFSRVISAAAPKRTVSDTVLHVVR